MNSYSKMSGSDWWNRYVFSSWQRSTRRRMTEYQEPSCSKKLQCIHNLQMSRTTMHYNGGTKKDKTINKTAFTQKNILYVFPCRNICFLWLFWNVIVLNP